MAQWHSHLFVTLMVKGMRHLFAWQIKGRNLTAFQSWYIMTL